MVQPRRGGHQSAKESWRSLPQSWGFWGSLPGSPAAPRGRSRYSLPLVAPVPQWRQDYPNYQPPTRATAISEMGQNPPPAPQKDQKAFAPVPPSPVSTQPRSRYGVRIAAHGR
jgi:hypothetical protein